MTERIIIDFLPSSVSMMASKAANNTLGHKYLRRQDEIADCLGEISILPTCINLSISGMGRVQAGLGCGRLPYAHHYSVHFPTPRLFRLEWDTLRSSLVPIGALVVRVLPARFQSMHRSLQHDLSSNFYAMQ